MSVIIRLQGNCINFEMNGKVVLKLEYNTELGSLFCDSFASDSLRVWNPVTELYEPVQSGTVPDPVEIVIPAHDGMVPTTINQEGIQTHNLEIPAHNNEQPTVIDATGIKTHNIDFDEIHQKSILPPSTEFFGVSRTGLVHTPRIQINSSSTGAITGEISSDGVRSGAWFNNFQTRTLDGLTVKSFIKETGEIQSIAGAGQKHLEGSVPSGGNFNLSVHNDGNTHLTTSGTFYINGTLVPQTFTPVDPSYYYDAEYTFNGPGTGSFHIWWQKIGKVVFATFGAFDSVVQQPSTRYWIEFEALFVPASECYFTYAALLNNITPEYRMSFAKVSPGTNGDILFYKNLAMDGWLAGQEFGMKTFTAMWRTLH